MNPIEWLEKEALGFCNLPREDRDAIFHFSLLWSLFEAMALNTRANARSIVALVHERAAQGHIDAQAFEPMLRYFRARYFDNNEATKYFHGLRLGRGDNPQLVRDVLQGSNNNPEDSVAALLIVVYRLRNNLFHGVKWSYGIQGQRENFDRANATLMHAITQLVPHDA